jgi:hypothetical protein
MTNWDSSQPITLEIGPTFGSTSSDIDRVRNGQISWLNEIDAEAEHIFTLKIPLELVGVAAGKPSMNTNSRPSPPSSLSFMPTGDVTVHGVTPDPPLRDLLCSGGEIDMSVDALSRSIILTEVDERTFIETLQDRTDIDTVSLDVFKRALVVPTFYDEFDQVTATQAHDLLRENIRRHEREHVRCLINPETAIWREFELYWRSVFIGAKPQTWHDSAFLDRLVSLYQIPSRFTVELLALLNEDYTIDDPTIQRAVETSVSAQRGTESTLLQEIENSSVDTDNFLETMQLPVAEQYCDLWLAYVLDALRSGDSLADIDAADFHHTCAPLPDSYDLVVREEEAQTLYVDLMQKRLLGPVFELVSLTYDGTFTLKRAWYSLNPGASDRERLVAVRRVLYRRQFFSGFVRQSGLKDALHDREEAVKQVIRGTSLDESSLFDSSLPSLAYSTETWADHLESAYETAATVLLGSQSTADEFHTWLNDPEYGFT